MRHHTTGVAIAASVVGPSISTLAMLSMPPAASDARYLLSSVTRAASDTGHPVTILPENLQSLIESATRWDSLFDGVDRVLLLLGSRADRFFAKIAIDRTVDYPLVCALGERQMNEILVVAGKLGLFDIHQSELTIDGWRHIDQLRQARPKARQAFVAMWFAEEMREAWVAVSSRESRIQSTSRP